MHTVMLNSRADAEGFLHLKVPVALPNAEIKVTIILQPILPVSADQTPEELGWSPGFFEETFGAWEGELERESQGEYEQRK
jgi:hypothetical protein